MDMTPSEVRNLEALLKNRSAVKHMHATDVAKILRNIHDRYEERFLDKLDAIPDDMVGDVLLELPETQRQIMVSSLSSDKLRNALEAMESDDAVDLLEHIEEYDENKAQLVLNKLSKQDREELKRLKAYEENSVGAYMQTELFDAWMDETLGDALKDFREQKKENEPENVHQVFIVDEMERHVASIRLEELLLHEHNRRFKEIVQELLVVPQTDLRVLDTADIDEAVRFFQDYDLSSLAVVDAHGILVGRLTSDDIHDIIEENATTQIYNLAGVGGGHGGEIDDAEAKFWRPRAIWLLVNLGTMIVASSIIGLFEETISSYVALAVLMPIIPALSGNAGIQALTVTIRQIALGNVSFGNARKNLYSEMRIAFLNGGSFSILIGLITTVWFGDPWLGVTMSLALLLALTIAGFLGASIPVLLVKLGVDPAVGSSVVITGMIDSLSFFSLFGLATLILL